MLKCAFESIFQNTSPTSPLGLVSAIVVRTFSIALSTPAPWCETQVSPHDGFMNSDYRCNSENCLINDCIINCLHEATDADILSKMDALRYIGKYFRNLLPGQKFVSDVELGEFFIAILESIFWRSLNLLMLESIPITDSAKFS